MGTDEAAAGPGPEGRDTDYARTCTASFPSRPQRPVAGRVAVVRLVELRKDDGARGHVDADGKRLRREDELH